MCSGMSNEAAVTQGQWNKAFNKTMPLRSDIFLTSLEHDKEQRFAPQSRQENLLLLTMRDWGFPGSEDVQPAMKTIHTLGCCVNYAQELWGFSDIENTSASFTDKHDSILSQLKRHGLNFYQHKKWFLTRWQRSHRLGVFVMVTNSKLFPFLEMNKPNKHIYI